MQDAYETVITLRVTGLIDGFIIYQDQFKIDTFDAVNE